MATPVEPVIPGCELEVTRYAEDQEQYRTLPVYKFNDDTGTVLSRWKLTWKERLLVLVYGDIYLFQLTFGDALQPVLLTSENPIDESPVAIPEMEVASDPSINPTDKR